MAAENETKFPLSAILILGEPAEILIFLLRKCTEFVRICT